MSKKILIVDDEEDVRLFVADFLGEREFQVTTAESAEDALEKFKKSTYDIVLLDVMMPGMDGIQCLELIKKDYPKTAVIMITALKDEVRMAKAKKLGAVQYIIKPFSLTYLETELMNIIKEA